jgi:hypothetical protein
VRQFGEKGVSKCRAFSGGAFPYGNFVASGLQDPTNESLVAHFRRLPNDHVKPDSASLVSGVESTLELVVSRFTRNDQTR